MTDLFEIEAPTTTTSLELRRLQRDTRRRQRRIRTLVASAVGLVLLALGASIAWNFIEALKPAADLVADYEGFGQGQVQIIINPGDDGGTIAATLYDNGVVKSEKAFLNETYSNPEGALKIQPGYYVLPKEMKAEYVLGMLIDPGDRKLTKDFTIIEGWTQAKILERVSSIGGYTLEDVQLIASDTAALGLPPEAGGNLEGWLFPDTYSFNPDVHPADVLAAMVQRTVAVLEDNDVPREAWEDTLIIASIVEREAGSDADRPKVASIIKNRIAAGTALEMCSTVRYFIPGGIYVSDAETQTENPYNTYLHTGLPPGPISSPGESSIKASLGPALYPYIFMVTVNPATGETRFATTYQEHLANVDVYHQWCSDNGGCQ